MNRRIRTVTILHNVTNNLLLIADIFSVTQFSQNRNTLVFKDLLFYRFQKKFLSLNERSLLVKITFWK